MIVQSILYRMGNGAQTLTENLSRRLLRRWVPKWYEAFTDGAGGGFHERVGHSFKPVKTGQRRLLTQCRQLSIYAHAVSAGQNRLFKPDLKRHFAFIAARYRAADEGGWIFSLDDDGKVSDRTYDLYAHAFVIFAFAHYYKVTKDETALKYARQTLDFVSRNFRIKNKPGFYEALDEDGNPLVRVRRHESHMHFMEGCLFAFESFGDRGYLDMASEMADLFTGYFYDSGKNLLSEYFDEDLENPVPENGHIIAEPGHYCEWLWLLKKYERLSGKSGAYASVCANLLDWANRYGWDGEYGGIYDELSPDGRVVKDTKRLWPFTEALKANALMLDDEGQDKDFLKSRMAAMTDVFTARYMEERGFWTEWLDRDFTPATDYMPGTTPYHVYFGIMEARDALARRGPSKSLKSGFYDLFYAMRRGLSARVRTVRNRRNKRAV